MPLPHPPSQHTWEQGPSARASLLPLEGPGLLAHIILRCHTETPLFHSHHGTRHRTRATPCTVCTPEHARGLLGLPRPEVSEPPTQVPLHGARQDPLTMPALVPAAPTGHPQCEAPQNTQATRQSTAVTLPWCEGHPGTRQPLPASTLVAMQSTPALSTQKQSRLATNSVLAILAGGLLHRGPWDPPWPTHHFTFSCLIQMPCSPCSQSPPSPCQIRLQPASPSQQAVCA